MARFNTDQPAFRDFRDIVRERTNPVVAWVGAGLSRPAGLPAWAELKAGLLQDLDSFADAVPDALRARDLKARADAIRAEPDLWSSFSNLKTALGKTQFCASVRGMLGSAVKVTVPQAYERIWSMNVSGILTLNIDGFAKRSFGLVHAGKALSEFDGNDVHERVLKSNVPFIGNLHGSFDDERSWIFTRADLDLLLRNLRYRNFITTILGSRTVLFMGITVDDIAVAEHLAYLKGIEFDAGDHFWLTERADQNTADFAEKLGIRPILFDASGGDYSAIDEFFVSIEKYLPPEMVAPPAFSKIEKDRKTQLLSPDELCKLESDEIRWNLNINASDILSPENEEAYVAYDDFCRKYNQAIYRAWYVGAETGSSRLLGYRLIEEVKHPGAFGRVFRAESPSGDIVAVKVLHEGIRRDPERLQSFRRGARAMKILTSHDLAGMVRFREALEIPAMVAMDWIEGPNLKTAVESRFINDWKDLLRVGSSLAQVLRTAHKLPERVLHRDVRPPNIMLNNRYIDDINWKLVVLDFDLSWHRDSVEKSISSANSPTGYLAPEQLSRQPGVSTRNAAVDSFGVGMTLFFMASRRDPAPNEHARKEWPSAVCAACRDYNDTDWRCIPNRVARLILKATRDRQPDRCDMALMERELTKLHSLESGDRSFLTAVVLMEEVAARSGHGYEWDSDGDKARLATTRGLEIVLESDEPSGSVSGSLRWSQEHAQEYETIRKYLPRRADAAKKMLEEGTWSASKELHGAYGVTLTFSARMPASDERIDSLASSLSRALMEISKVA